MHPNKQQILLGMLVILSAITVQAHAEKTAETWQSRDSILTTAQNFLEEYAQGIHAGRTEIKLGKLDPRLRLKACTEQLQGFMSPGGREMGNTTVGVRCPGEAGWSIYVSAKINVFGPVLISKQPLPRGTPVSEKDLTIAERNLAVLPYGYYIEAQPVIGMLTKRTLAANTVLTPQMLKAPKLVKRGERVTLIGETGSLKVRMVGEALSDGGQGDLIRVRADGSKRIIDGTVISQGVIKVTL